MKGLLLSLLVFAGCSEPPELEPVLRPVRTTVVHKTDGELNRSFSGTTQPSDQAALGFKVSGRVNAVYVEVGDVVTAGDLLSEIDDTELRLQRDQAQASLAQARATFQSAQSTKDRVQALFVNDNASAADVDGAQAQYDASAAQVSAAARQRDLAQRQLDDARLLAPYDGAVAQVMVNADEIVGSGTPVLVVTSSNRLKVNVGVPGTLIHRVERSMPVVVQLVGLDEREVKGTVSEVAVAAAGSTFPVTVVLD